MPPQAPSEAGLLTFTSNNPALTQPVTDPVNRLKEETLAFFVRRGAQAPEGSLAYRFYGTGYALVGALAPESVPEFMAGAALGPVGSKVGGLGIKQLNRLPVLGADVGEGIAQGIQGSAKYLRDLGVPDWKITPRPYEYGTLNANPLPFSLKRVWSGGNSTTSEFITDLHGAIKQKINVGELAEYKMLDPNAKIGLTGSSATGKVGNPNKATFGQPIDPNKFDLDLFVQSDVLLETYGTKLKAAPVLRQSLVDDFPDLFKGLKPGKDGLSIKFRPTGQQPEGSIMFDD
ncbi:hypothetical protein [Parvibium lacunae]|uniref:Uncharacterized protein n=1 Tax=Parvibium lacunae TaxID=1888893 RepID=A0A368KYD0_9BURK|nr:hypothetical protein [Parvibium lacunae]RCS56457.1 hypothetical protein DU000_12050 [Parvibium lacunae]